MKHLVNYDSQIERNLCRTAELGLISLLDQSELEKLAYEYFGVKDEEGNIIGYTCPYSGKIFEAPYIENADYELICALSL